MLFYLSNLFLFFFHRNFRATQVTHVNLLIYIPNRASARDGDGAQQVVRCRCSYDCSSQHLVRSQQQCNNVHCEKYPDVMQHQIYAGLKACTICCICPQAAASWSTSTCAPSPQSRYQYSKRCSSPCSFTYPRSSSLGPPQLNCQRQYPSGWSLNVCGST